MRKYFIVVCEETEARIEELKKRPENNYLPYIVLILESGLEKLKEFIDQHPFESDQEEIHFFKNLKPTIIARLIYYKKINQITLEKPLGKIEGKKAQLNSEFNRLTRYFKANKTFIDYMRTGKTYLDEKYFLRKNVKENQMPESFSCEIDYQHGTGYDYKIGVILAHEMLEEYLTEELEYLNNPPKLLTFKNSTCGSTYEDKNLKWTESQTALVEIIYALHASGAFNNGNAEIKDIAECFASAFNIKINQLYRTFSDIKNRKNDRLKFLDTMKSLLEKNIDEDYEL